MLSGAIRRDGGKAAGGMGAQVRPQPLIDRR